VHTPCLTLTSVTGGALLAALAFVPAAYADTAPVARDDSYGTGMNTNLVIGAPGVLANDTDADGDPLTATLAAGAQHGNVSISGNGAFTYVPTTNYVGPDQFTYKACDPTGTTPPVTPPVTTPPVTTPPVTTPPVVTTPSVIPPPVVTPPATTPPVTTPPAPTVPPVVTIPTTPSAFVVSMCDQATVFITVRGGVATPPPVGGGVVIYPTCAAAFRAGVHDIARSDPRYRIYLDADRDGIACELNGNDGTPPVTIIRPPGNTTIVKPPPAPNNTTIVNPPAAPNNTTIVVPPAPSGSGFGQIGQAPAGAAATGFGPNA
jgi:hypothetical protein